MFLAHTNIDDCPQIEDNKIRIRAECVRVIYQNRIPSLVSVLVASFLPIIVGLQEETRPVTLLSVLVLWVYVAINWVLCRWFNRSVLTERQMVRWGLVFYVEHFALAVLLTSIFSYYVLIGVEGAVEYLILVTLGFSAGSVSAFHQMKWAPPIFITSSVSPQIIYHFSQGTRSNSIIAIMLMIILVFMCVISFEQHKTWIRTLALSLELEAEKKKADLIARIDLLTGLFNRRAFYEIAPKFIEQGRRHHRPVSIVMLDIDHFKTVNDKHGHGVGDRVLASIAKCLKTHIRSSDVVGRLGGEEFALLLPETDRSGAVALVEKLRKAVSDLSFSEESDHFHVTSSFGIVSTEDMEGPLEGLLTMADWALYQAKEQGRNRTIIFEPTVHATTGAPEQANQLAS
ncbi:GGDEF domain-containing protein [uncultured Cohaesibacter sp.]|uniref:sensor domain-containing diguanylate cyclase n=1 Tax=uncultured Cohaesibacter sp. TaxID=1002546 RepID=UPI002931DA98|nr:GGDEF domain-containing protein [uncultured Cohaesibacter sp.]